MESNRVAGKHRKAKKDEAGVAWRSILQRGFRDGVLLIFGGWILYKQVYSVSPSLVLCAIGVGFMVPSLRAAIFTILSLPSESSDSHPSERQLPSSPSSKEDTGERTLLLHLPGGTHYRALGRDILCRA